jgi:hypothetical protein
MSGSFSSLNPEVEGFGESSMADLAELRKALEIGYQQPTTGLGFDALRVESLDSTLRLMTYTAQHLKMWNLINKSDAYSTVEEFNLLLSYGSDGGGFVPSGVLPEEEDSTYERTDQKVKYLGTTRAVHHPSTLVRTVPADLIAQETQNGAMWLLGKANYSLYHGDSDSVPLEWNGIIKQVEDGAGTVIDLQGGPLLPETIEQAAEISVDAFGVPTQLFANAKVFSDFSNTFLQYQRFTSPGSGGVAGTPITGFNTLSGGINFQSDTFLKRGGEPQAIPSSPKAPSAPTIAIATPAVNAASKFKASDAGAYKYQVTGVNQYGESAPSALSAAVTMPAGDSAAITITDGGGAYGATAYRVYRTEKDGTKTYYIGDTTPRGRSGGVYTATTVFTDINKYRPRTFTGMMLDMTQQSLTFRQLAPMMKMNLAIISPAIRWMQLLYGTPIVFAPKRNVIFRNIGSST